MTKLRMFFYGTLKRGQPNSHVTDSFGDRVRYVGDAVTKEKYRLVVATDRNTPFLLHPPGQGQNVKGELYDVHGDEAVSELDEFELVGRVYEREEITVCTNEGEQSVWAYIFTKHGPVTRDLPALDDYDNHSLPESRKYVSQLREADWCGNLASLVHQLQR